MRTRRVLLITVIGLFGAGARADVLFDFDNAPIHTLLPIDLTVGGITAHFTASGQGYSIQRADTMGFTPQGFGGNCIYPSSVFQADLMVDFAPPLTAFSIMFAPQELGCDDTARMRVTAYMSGTLVGTSTAYAPQPGTWPTGTLSFSSAAAFNHVVIHYDQRPQCTDYGPIFMADNMDVTASPCAGILRGDSDGNGVVNNFDIDAFVAALSNRGACGRDLACRCRNDTNGDGIVNSFDTDSFVTCLTAGCP